ncbi:MAG: pantoate--beta-alanine ligase [Proteobacteria bacterium]|nr:pantoate--beta-alanine ligase [Pseudomonadota bacterium]
MPGPTPETVPTLPALRRRLASWREEKLSIGLVPTMGALHDGHLSLIRRAQEECDRVLVSIFVNPKQFAPGEDLDAYPRDQLGDLETLASYNVSLVYTPEPDGIYGDGFATVITVQGLTDEMCGRSRPHFFSGVATIVAKLLIQSMPDKAYFGEKDYQQLLVIRRLASDLDIPVEVIGCPIIREEDGLALSSRNAFLSDGERLFAPALHQILQTVSARAISGEPCRTLEDWAKKELLRRGFTAVDYVDVRHEMTLEPVDIVERSGAPARVFAAAYLGATRLIDNIPLRNRN